MGKHNRSVVVERVGCVERCSVACLSAGRPCVGFAAARPALRCGDCGDETGEQGRMRLKSTEDEAVVTAHT